VAVPLTAGVPEVDVARINNIVTSSVTAVNANQGTTQPINFTGVGASAFVQTDARNWLGSPVTAVTAGVPDVNVKNINAVSAASVSSISANLGTVQPVNFTGTGASAFVQSDVRDWLGTGVSAATAGIPDVNTKSLNNISTSGVTAVSANVGTTQPINFTGTGGSALVQSDTRDIGGTPVSSPLATNVTQINGIAIAAVALAQSTQTICWGTCTGGTLTTAVVGTLNNPSSLTTAQQLLGRTIVFLFNTTTAGLQCQASNITNNTTGATPTITFTAMTNAPANGDTFVVI